MRCRTLHTAGQLSELSGHRHEASLHLEAALSIARELGDVGRTATILQDLGRTSIARGELATARGHLEEALTLSGKSDNKRGLASALTNMAILKRVEDNLPAAAMLYDRALALTSEIGDQQSVAIARLNLAMVHIGRGNLERARSELVQVFEIAESIGSKPAGLSALETCAGLAAATSQWKQAALFFGASESEAGKTGIVRDVADERFLRPLMDAARRALPEPEFVAAESTGAQLGYEQAVDTARTWLEEGVR
jgi:tetratricopeptide (TPR) repeat protein